MIVDIRIKRWFSVSNRLLITRYCGVGRKGRFLMFTRLSGIARQGLGPTIAAIVWLALPMEVFADDDFRIIKAEEEWELVVAEPDSDTTAPQVTCMMSPVGGDDGLHMTFELNHKSGSQFVAGGLTMQLWDGETWISTNRGESTRVMSTAAETVRWTQSMRVDGDNLTFEVKNGISVTWGEFGDSFRASAPWGKSSINGYSPQNSTRLSGIGFASNRVQSLVLKKFRVYLSTGQVYENNTPRVVYSRD
jgi:hypothetical protein